MQQRFLKRPKNSNREFIKELDGLAHEMIDKHMKENHDAYVAMFKKAGSSEEEIPAKLEEVKHEAQVKMIKFIKEKVREKLLEKKSNMSLNK